MNAQPALSKRIEPFLIPLLTAITFAIYWPAHAFDFVEYDDGGYITANLHLQQGITLASMRWAMTVYMGNWHPLTLLSYLTISTIFGTGPAAFHLFNASIHSINAAMLYVFLFAATRRSWPSFFAAALWAWHPLRVESVAWISELKDVLCGFFWLGCTIAYAHYRRRPSAARYVAIAICLVLALLAKPMAVTLPAALLLLCFWPLRRENGLPQLSSKWWRNRLLEVIPLALLCIGDAAVAFITQRTASQDTLNIIPAGARAANALVSYVSYLQKMLIPIHLAIFYPHPAMLGRDTPTYQLLIASVVLVLITMAVTAQRRARPYLLAGWLWFIVTLLPVIGFIQVGAQAMADRYTYLPSIGPTIAIVWLIADFRLRLRRAIPIAAAVACAALLSLTALQLRYWRNTETLFTHADQVVPDNYVARQILSTVYRSQGRHDLAVSMAQSAVNLTPGDQKSHFALALALHDARQRGQAWTELQTAIALDPNNSVFHNDAGAMLLEQGRRQEAMAEFRRATELNPDAVDARHNFALLLLQDGQYAQAIAQWQQALLLAPGNATMTGWLAEAFRLSGQIPQAIESYQAAFAAGDRNATHERNFAWLIATDPAAPTAQIQSAIALARDACDQTTNNDPYSLDALAAALARSGQLDRAVKIAQQAQQSAAAKNDAELVKAIQSRIALYQAGRPYLPGK